VSRNTVATGLLEANNSHRFLLSALQIQFILEQTTRKGVRNALKRAPKALNEVFEGILTRIKQQPASRSQLAMRTLLLIAHSKRPLAE
jgi:hypothetical protein